MIKLTTTLVAAILLVSTGFSQSHDHSHDHPGNHWCGKNEFKERYFEAHPEARIQEEIDRAELEEFTRNFTDERKDGDPIIIPVVFHVVHANGNENISDEQIHDAIDMLNLDYNESNADIGNTSSAFEDLIADVGLEFRLARKDPNGNCTNGINRVYDLNTFDATDNVKDGDASIWTRSRYLNVWVVNSIEGGTAAYAYLPANWSTQVDGILIEHNHVGSIGTSEPYHRHTLSHEVGHYLNLEHPWGGSNTPGIPSNCNGDDGVSDTPNTIGYQWYGQNCDLSASSCGSLDNVQNFMDYSWCSTMFTSGQKSRMIAALNSNTGSRNNLWTDNNLSFTGVLDPEVVCQAEFSTTVEPIVCVGQTLEFVDESYNGVTEWEWTFEGGSPSSSNAADPSVTYDTPGTYSVTLTAGNANGSETETKTNFVTVLPLGENQLPFSEGFESISDLEDNDDNWYINNPDGNSVMWEITDDAAYSGSKSAYVRGRSNTTANYSYEYLMSPTYDLSEIEENAVLTFKYAHARRLGSSDDELRVWISRNCGELWSVRRTLDMDDLPTVSNNVSGQFVPESQDDWTEVEIDNIVSVFLNDEFRVRFEFRSYRGNNLYLDDINLVDGATLGLDGVTFLERLTLYPNPAQDQASLEYTLQESGAVTIDILDLSGRVVKQVFNGFQPTGQQLIQIPLSDLSKGVYMVRMQSSGEQIVRKLVRE